MWKFTCSIFCIDNRMITVRTQNVEMQKFIHFTLTLTQEWVQKLDVSPKGKLSSNFKQDLTFKTIYQNLIQNIIYPLSSSESVTINYPSTRVVGKLSH